MIEELAYAKVNLGLRVLDKRSDGYHEIKTVMVPINLFDTLTFELNKKDELISNYQIDDNFIIKALNLFKETYHITECVRITLDKKIPIGAGLAGGSSDAAATLRGLNRLFNLNISLKELSELSMKLGSDMPYCVYSKLAYCTGRGENVLLLNATLPKMKMLLIKPKYSLSTKLVYQNYLLIPSSNQLDKLLASINNSDNNFVNYLFNDLEATSFKLEKSLDELFTKIKTKGYNVRMSGSGPTLFIIGDNLDNLFEEYKNEYDCFITSTLENNH